MFCLLRAWGCSVWFVHEGFCILPLKIICEAISTTGKGLLFKVKNNHRKLSVIERFIFFSFFLAQKEMPPPVPLISGWVTFHHFQWPYPAYFTDHAKDNCVEGINLDLFARHLFLDACTVLEMHLLRLAIVFYWKMVQYLKKTCKIVELYCFHCFQRCIKYKDTCTASKLQWNVFWLVCACPSWIVSESDSVFSRCSLQ